MNFIKKKKSQITKTYQNKKRPKENKENLINRENYYKVLLLGFMVCIKSYSKPMQRLFAFSFPHPHVCACVHAHVHRFRYMSRPLIGLELAKES